MTHTRSMKDGGDGLDRSEALPKFLLDGGTRKLADCGCELRIIGDYVQVYQCSMHAAAEDLLTACEAMVHAAEMGDSALGGVAATLADAAVRKARGE